MVDKSTEETRRLIIEQLYFHPLPYSDKHFLGFACQFINPRNDLFCLQRNHNFKVLLHGMGSRRVFVSSDQHLFELLHVAFRLKL